MGCHPRLAAVRRGESSSWDTVLLESSCVCLAHWWNLEVGRRKRAGQSGREGGREV